MALSQPAQLVTKSAIQFDALILLTAFTMGFVLEGNSIAKVARYVMKKYLRLVAFGESALFLFLFKSGREAPFHSQSIINLKEKELKPTVFPTIITFSLIRHRN